ncbi:hypothetical protein NMY22_g1140 [Coprinellus aureogranulatus]|nr:hypothetical protein NMY22_g1140 [Coprinellus aureogranulatus]
MSSSSQPPSLTTPASSSSVPQNKRSGAFEFTKKKRWGDLVTADTVEDVGFIVNRFMTVLWCGPAICEVLGWRETDLLDAEVTEYMNEEDQERFRDDFESSLQSNTWFDTQVRMKVNVPAVTWTELEETQVAFRGRPASLDTDEGRIPVVFLYGKHRNPTSQHTALDLELERLVLEARLAELREEATPELLAELAVTEGSNSFYTSSNLAARQATEGEDQEARAESTLNLEESSLEASKGSPATDEEAEDGDNPRKKKKPKKAHPNEHHVCMACGRADSPEWRKGPQGPKTLCNACGLRWAKQVRTKNEQEKQTSRNLADESSGSAGSTPSSAGSGAP